ncbi:MAG: cytochrome c biogenesis protein CcsA [Leptolyngbyaceae cyanobacterium MO_188.B28]|nr:cytochrome c biogenesis protein CcsA [Leptolyngbyaceae cyanobacterium MO_188.B28]
MKRLKFLIGFCLGVLIVFAPFNQFQASPLEPLKTIAVQLDGRKKPLDTVAKETTAKIHGSTYYHPTQDETWDYLQTYLSLWFNQRNWSETPFILFSYRPLKAQLGLVPEQKYFAFEDLVNNDRLAIIVQQAHQRMLNGEALTRDQREALTIQDRLDLTARTVGGDTSLPLVPHPETPRGVWTGLSEAQTRYPPERISPLIAQFKLLRQVYLSKDDPASTEDRLAQVGRLASQLRQDLAALSPQVYPADSDLRREVHFNRFHPFAKACCLYAIAFLGMLLAIWWEPLELYWSVVGIFVAGVLFQGYGFWLRMQIAGRPPVTNMYESVVWVGFGIVVLALTFELTYRVRYYLLAAAPLSVLCLILADSLPAVLDPGIAPLVPVLRDNFWLSIHVPTIALSYASFALAMGLGHVTLGNYLFTPQAKPRIQTLSQLNYRVLQVGVLLLITGIILGGVWAYFSWGRFWGWDPKETWTLIALLCYLAPLYSRLMGWIGDFGVSIASVVSFNAVLMAWYGVNFVLGVGLHTFGFSTGGSVLFVGSIVGLDLLFVLIALITYQGRSNAQSESMEETV